MKLHKSQLQISVFLALFLGLWRLSRNKSKKCKEAVGKSEVEELQRKVRQKNSKLRKDLASKDVSLVTTKINNENLKNSENEAKTKCSRLIAEMNEAREEVKKWKTENDRLRKELDAILVNKESDRKELISLTKSLEKSIDHTECLEQVNHISGELSNHNSEAAKNRAEEVRKQAIEIARLQKELETACSKLKAREETDRNDRYAFVHVHKTAEEALAQQEERYETAMAKLKDDIDILQKKLTDQNEAHKIQLAAAIEANENEVAKVEETQFQDCKNTESYAGTISSLKMKLEKSEQVREDMTIRLQHEEQLRVELLKQIEVYKEKLENHQLNLKEFEVVKSAVSLFQGKLDMQNKQFEINRRKLMDANKQLELYKVKVADCEKREIDANAQLQLEIQKCLLEYQKKETELINNFEHKEKELINNFEQKEKVLYGSEKKKLTGDVLGYKLRLSEFDEQLKAIWKLTNTETILGLKNKIEQMKKDALSDAAAVQFITAERDCATEELEIVKRERNCELSMVAVFFLVIVCVFCLWGKLDMWNKYF